jgi:hypothetical protein
VSSPETIAVSKHPNGKSRRSRRQRRSTTSARVARIGDKVHEFVAKTGISRPTAYRMMASGELRYVQITERIRLIPHAEYIRLGLIEAEAAT